MFKLILSKIFGVCKASCFAADAEEFAELVRTSGLTTNPIKFDDEGCSVILPESCSKRFLKLAGKKGIEVKIVRLFGIPYLVSKYKRRPGILLGTLIFFTIIIISGNIIWDFEITGNSNVSDVKIIESLEKSGCRSGAFIDDIDFDLIQNDCLIDSDELAWISVNMDGNLARVEVREKKYVALRNDPPSGGFANIIAAEDGVVEICRVRKGKSVVETGNVVKKGELLITGVIDVGETGVRYDYADGEVFAKVCREISAFTPFKFTKETPTGEKKTDITLKIFGKSINLSHRGSIDWDIYGKIKEEEKLSLPFGVTLPIWVDRTEYSKLTKTQILLTEEEALSMAKNDAYAKLQAMSDSVQLLSVSEDIKSDDNGVYVTLGVYCVTDISANYGFSVSYEDTEEDEDKPGNEENDNS